MFTSISRFLITASSDGHVKFWKKQTTGIEFVKDFRAHSAAVDGLSVSYDGILCATISEVDMTLKVFDVLTYDLMSLINLNFTPSGIIDWCYLRSDYKHTIAIGSKEMGSVHVFDVLFCENPLITINIHMIPVSAIRYNSSYDTVISTDIKGHVEYWRPRDGSFPKSLLLFSMKLETDLFDLAKEVTFSNWIEISPDGHQFVIYSADSKIRIFQFLTGKIRRIYDESLSATRFCFNNVFRFADESSIFHMESIDYGRSVAIERTIDNDFESYKVPITNAVFDYKGNYIIYPTLFGIKCINLNSNKAVKLYGKLESRERFLKVSLHQGIATQTKETTICDCKKTEPNPILAAIAYRKIRFFLFTRHEPSDDKYSRFERDKLNEKPTNEEIITNKQITLNKIKPNNAIFHTSRGEICIQLYADECPLTVENLTTHAKKGYYDGLLFHRVIKGFMIQTGDPSGDGTGGRSIWGDKFEDEIVKELRHDTAGTVSMANAGPNTNGSQFFITTVPCPWLDGNHTVFGKVTKGMDVVRSIERAKVDRNDKPIEAITIMNVELRD